jgi:hypothetical protein
MADPRWALGCKPLICFDMSRRSSQAVQSSERIRLANRAPPSGEPMRANPRQGVIRQEMEFALLSDFKQLRDGEACLT